MNVKVKEHEAIIKFYEELHSDLKSKNLHFYIAKSYYYDKIAEKFNISAQHASVILQKEWRKRERTYEN